MKWILIGAMLAAILLAGCGSEEKAICGNAICEQDLGENETICPNDCSTPPSPSGTQITANQPTNSQDPYTGTEPAENNRPRLAGRETGEETIDPNNQEWEIEEYVYVAPKSCFVWLESALPDKEAADSGDSYNITGAIGFMGNDCSGRQVIVKAENTGYKDTAELEETITLSNTGIESLSSSTANFSLTGLVASPTCGGQVILYEGEGITNTGAGMPIEIGINPTPQQCSAYQLCELEDVYDPGHCYMNQTLDAPDFTVPNTYAAFGGYCDFVNTALPAMLPKFKKSTPPTSSSSPNYNTVIYTKEKSENSEITANFAGEETIPVEVTPQLRQKLEAVATKVQADFGELNQELTEIYQETSKLEKGFGIEVKGYPQVDGTPGDLIWTASYGKLSDTQVRVRTFDELERFRVASVYYSRSGPNGETVTRFNLQSISRGVDTLENEIQTLSREMDELSRLISSTNQILHPIKYNEYVKEYKEKQTAHNIKVLASRKAMEIQSSLKTAVDALDRRALQTISVSFTKNKFLAGYVQSQVGLHTCAEGMEKLAKEAAEKPTVWRKLVNSLRWGKSCAMKAVPVAGAVLLATQLQAIGQQVEAGQYKKAADMALRNFITYELAVNGIDLTGKLGGSIDNVIKRREWLIDRIADDLQDVGGYELTAGTYIRYEKGKVCDKSRSEIQAEINRIITELEAMYDEELKKEEQAKKGSK